jgi:hypothetical protein
MPSSAMFARIASVAYRELGDSERALRWNLEALR